MDALLRIAFKTVFTRGNLSVTGAGGTRFKAGDGSGPEVAFRVTDYRTQYGILLDPELKFGEAYMNGGLVFEQGGIADFLAIALTQELIGGTPTWLKPLRLWRYLSRRLAQLNLRSKSRENVAHHYDLDARMYSLFLDSDRQYSCGYFETSNASLDDAQLAKKRHIASKLVMKPGKRVLDIGCGWGGLALYLAKFCSGKVTGVTLSKEQLAAATARASEQHLENAVEFRMQDYRDITEKFDRIVSVGMFEHVGVGFYDQFFRKAAEILDDDGVMVLHSISRSEPPTATNAWIAKYIFPGGYIPALSEVLPHIERSGLIVTDIEILRLHYAETLKAWRERFLAHREEVDRMYDSRFVRMWEFYLAGSEMAFRHQNMNVFQIQLAHRQGIVPTVRNYITQAEERLREIESREQAPMRMAGE
jgi:cyclopropane-fatty-acyl-phospholipid synthase